MPQHLQPQFEVNGRWRRHGSLRLVQPNRQVEKVFQREPFKGKVIAIRECKENPRIVHRPVRGKGNTPEARTHQKNMARVNRMVGDKIANHALDVTLDNPFRTRWGAGVFKKGYQGLPRQRRLRKVYPGKHNYQWTQMGIVVVLRSVDNCGQLLPVNIRKGA